MLACYGRVSTETQAEKGISLENQISAGEALSYKLGLDFKVFKDAGLSGTLPIDKRPGLQDLIDHIQRGKVTHLFVYDEDRLTRDVVQYYLLKSIFKEHNIKLYTVSGLIDYKDDGVSLLSDIKNVFASYEISKTRSRIKFNLEQSAKKGRWSGGKMLPFGYMKEYKILVVNPEEAKWVNKIYELCIEGLGTRRIANYLNELKVPTRVNKKWADGTIHGILKNTLYYGERKYKDIIIESPSIITKEIYSLAQQSLKNNIHFTPVKKYDYLLKGLVKCGYCGKTFYGRKRDTLKDNQYCCISSRYTKEFCGNRGINIDYLESVVINSVRDLDKNILKFYDWFEGNDMMISVMRDIKNLRKKEKDVLDKIDNLLNLGSEGVIPKDLFNKKMQSLNKEREELNERKLSSIPQLNLLNKKESILEDVRKMVSQIDKMDFLQKQNLVRAVVESVNVAWIPEKQYHLIVIEYKINNLSEYKMRSNIEVEYKKSGFTLRRVKDSASISIRQIGEQVYVNIQ